MIANSTGPFNRVPRPSRLGTCQFAIVLLVLFGGVAHAVGQDSADFRKLVLSATSRTSQEGERLAALLLSKGVVLSSNGAVRSFASSDIPDSSDEWNHFRARLSFDITSGNIILLPNVSVSESEERAKRRAASVKSQVSLESNLAEIDQKLLQEVAAFRFQSERNPEEAKKTLARIGIAFYSEQIHPTTKKVACSVIYLNRDSCEWLASLIGDEKLTDSSVRNAALQRLKAASLSNDAAKAAIDEARVK